MSTTTTTTTFKPTIWTPGDWNAFFSFGTNILVGFMHGETVGFAMTPTVALAYAMVAVFLFSLSKMPAEAMSPASMAHDPTAVPAE
jgi:hypothetical protein